MTKITNTRVLSSFRKQTNISKEEATMFSEAFQSALEKGLFRDKVVKISGLGTFKLVLVEARQSIDVTTKEKIEIASHYKVTFIPETSLKDRINQPLAHLETMELDIAVNEDNNDISSITNVDLDNPMQKLVDQAMELKEILLDIQGPSGETESVEDLSVSTAESKNSIKESNTTNTISNPEPTNLMHEKKEKRESDLISEKNLINEINIENGKENSSKTWVWILVAVLLFLSIIALLLYQNRDFFVPQKTIPQKTESITEKLNLTIVNPFESESAATQIEEDDLLQNLQTNNSNIVEVEPTIDFIESESESQSQTPKFSNIFTRKRTYTEFIGTIVLPEGGRLTWLALKQYGHKDYWVYIYEANTDIISNPNQVRSGIKLKIPKLDPQLIDTSNPETIEYARYLHDIYVKK